MILVTFHSVSSVLYLETLLRERRVRCAIIPVPRALGSSCGYAAEIDENDMGAPELKRVMADAIEWEGIYEGAPDFALIERARE
ncbi:MAG: DUF3343 domain-containing protein [Planctomycetota bacterium]|jgi:hypothetical protein|nr:DUF3343 domain-containing protein [Planctomycetota bacterium]